MDGQGAPHMGPGEGRPSPLRPDPPQEAVTQAWAASCRPIGSPEALLYFTKRRRSLPVTPLQPDHAQVCLSAAGVGPNAASEEHRSSPVGGVGVRVKGQIWRQDWGCTGLGAAVQQCSNRQPQPGGGVQSAWQELRGILSILSPPTMPWGRHGEAGHHQTHCEPSS